jgi:hypothetical protein
MKPVAAGADISGTDISGADVSGHRFWLRWPRLSESRLLGPWLFGP